jgi:ectoine hydroxylase-related dioxygenase (phytanoyl-CoA dioxygenase family)
MSNSAEFQQAVAQDGFALVNGVASAQQVIELQEAIAAIPEGDEVRRRQNVYGVRNLLDVSPETRRLASSASIRGLVASVLGPDCFAVRATFFDKVPDANWNLGYHQDRVIAVKQHVEAPGFYAWSEKAGVLQVQPPESVLMEMLAIRVHLDDYSDDNGPLRVLSGTHRRAWPREEISRCRSEVRETVCKVAASGVLAMRPLLLHASSASGAPRHRRVIHIEFAHEQLPSGLEWHRQV